MPVANIRLIKAESVASPGCLPCRNQGQAVSPLKSKWVHAVWLDSGEFVAGYQQTQRPFYMRGTGPGKKG